MSEREGEFRLGKNEHSRETEMKHNITEIYNNSGSVEELERNLDKFHEDEELVLELHVSEADPDSITYIMNRFPHARVVIAADREDYDKHKNMFPISVEWPGNQ